VLLTPGGEEDNLYGFADEDRSLIESRLARVADQPGHPRVAHPANLQESIDLREQLLLSADNAPAVFVNIGGHSANYGVGASALALPSGYIAIDAFNPGSVSGDSVALRALRREIPVINMINVRSIAMEHPQYFSSSMNEAHTLTQSRWPVGQRLVAALAALCLITACIMIRNPTEEFPHHAQGEPSHV
jgi:poly-gamma-glutamate system protein